MENQNVVKGLGGWLILVGAGIVINPIRLLVILALYLPIFSDGTWEALTTVGSKSYHPLLGPELIGEIICNMVLVAVSIYFIYLFFSKR